MSTKRKSKTQDVEEPKKQSTKPKMSDFGSVLSAMTSLPPANKKVTIAGEADTPKKSSKSSETAKDKFSVKRGSVSEVASIINAAKSKLVDKRRKNSRKGLSAEEVKVREEETQKSLLKSKTKMRKLLLEKDHVTPQHTDKEKKLIKIATKGVVTLFNAVNEQQKKIEEIERNINLRADEKEKLSKVEAEQGFLQLLKEKSRKSKEDDSDDDSDDDDNSENDNEEDMNTKSKGWKALDDNYMLGSKMKQWDKDSDSDGDSDSD